MAEQSVNIPQLLAVLLVGFLAVRWYFSTSESSSSSSSSSANRGSAAARGRQVDPARVEQISSMFPQLSRRDIMWDLQRNGGSVQATTERILGGRGLDAPPPSFQPQVLASSTPDSQTPAAPIAPLPTHPDLITRYNLSSRVSAIQPDISGSETAPVAQGWSQNKAERQQLLQRRREEMILAARRKMEEKDRTSKLDAS
ncbi:MAG: hypothetical protein M1820_004526 [Bogoriella megaspora]|nr:MAG: hypothetical protein M1820_004526 [Bogoriella megaspora]